MYEVNYFFDRFVRHIRKVQDNMILLEKNRDKLPFKIQKYFLFERGMYHDLKKLSKKFIKYYIDSNKYYFCKKNNIKYNGINISKIKEIKKIHYITEKHHPNSKNKMSKIDICEMCCDISAIAYELGEKDYTKYYREELLKEHYFLLNKYSDNILKILILLQELNNNNDL